MKKAVYEIIHHGAVDGVTGSCHELKINNKEGILIDCGLFQGAEKSSDGADANQLEIEFEISHIKALVVTHCHIDHVGRIPYLLGAGFDGSIICTMPTAKLLPLILKDALHIGVTKNKRLIERFIDLIEERIVAVEYGKWHNIELPTQNAELKIKFSPAGHVIGSAYVECEIKENNKVDQVLFSGDLGATHTPILISPNAPEGTDVLILESTYGDKNHNGRKERRKVLKSIVEHCFKDRGVIIIPAFSIGRTQELLYEFEQIIHEFGETKAHDKGKWEDVEVVIDSPLANNFTEVYKSLKDFWDYEAQDVVKKGRHPLAFDQMTTIGDHKEHLSTVEYLSKTARPTIVIAASGMCTGGRVVNYLKSMLGDSRTDVVFVGYQSVGTPGRDIQKYGPRGGYVDIDGKRFDIKAQIHTLRGYSAHADQEGLLDFVRKMKKKPQEIRLVHGDDRIKRIFQDVLQKEFPDINVLIP
ncbi:MBL fold metallo-hydrolase RNA specificity domain-containing protein [Candidatus Uabimicrobium sp. HlEnr_7]|uniref:MBL fold metallo-hydrolase RNA specificity domain-containing protein n=1 Tax=Candidatus Uabimicrobium helgolandensis TaxID=3095367 RepID=UPI0035585122